MIWWSLVDEISTRQENEVVIRLTDSSYLFSKGSPGGSEEALKGRKSTV